MKGPGLRNDMDIRRAWLCPRCGRVLKKLGDVVAMVCPCVDPPVQMQIQPDPPKRAFRFEKIEIALTEEDLQIRERPRRMPLPTPVEENSDRRPQRPKRPKPERKSFETFVQEGIDEAARTAQSDETADAVDSVVPQDLGSDPGQNRQMPASVDDEEFGEGL